MTHFAMVVLTIGFILLALGVFAGYSLLSRALKSKDKYGDETNVGTLWGLFICGILFGLLFTYFSLPQ
ncbi:MAG: hypothetical protein ACRDBT_08020 [Aeromonas sp.]